MENLYADLEAKLGPLATALEKPQPGDWLATHFEPGQTFAEYKGKKPVRKSDSLHTIYLCLVGDFTKEQKRILSLTDEYLGIFFDSPVKVNKHLPLEAIPAHAKRVHPSWGDRQILTTYLLEKVLEAERPDDALAYLALTATDLWPGEGWNFVFGEADLRERTGVWSIYRNGDPEKDFTLCLKRTIATASHETGHILSMKHCTAYQCLMNGSNHLEEKDRRPLHLCPICLRKLCWNLQVEPVPYLERLAAFCRRNDLETEWYEQAIAALAGKRRREP